MDIDENQFKLYFRMAKNLAFNLPDEKDRVKASKWIKKIEETTDGNAKRTKFHVIQLLLLSLQRKELVGPFEKPPRDDATLTSYKWSFQPSDIARLILRKEYERIGEPEVHVEMSGDLCEFVAYQEIPNFGTHFFYAFSPEHIHKWTNLDKDIIPKGLLNITVISSPDTSILRKSVINTLTQRGQTDNSAEYAQLKEDLKTSLYSSVLDNCGIDSEPVENYEENVMKTPASKRICDNVQTTGRKLFENTMSAIELQEGRLARNKRSMVAKLPERLKERLTKKFLPKEQQKYPDRDPNLARTPEIFRRDAHKIKNFRKYKPEEFLLTKDEKFRPAYEAFNDLQYMPPENARRSPGKTYIPRSVKPCHAEEDRTPVQDVDDSQTIEKSFERSFKKMQHEKLQRQDPERSTPSRRNELLERLEKLKANQAKRVVFDDMDVDIETEEIAFDKFVYKELPEDDEPVTILDNTEMLYEDIFGEDQICDVDVLPYPRPIQELEQAEILLDTEMQLDDIFGEDEIANPKAVFKDVSIEGERVVIPKSGLPEKGSYRVGRRFVALPGEDPIAQTYFEQTGNENLFNESLLRNQDNTPPLDDSMINKILDEKLKKYKHGENALPRTYGAWATKFNTEIEKLERGEDLDVESENVSYLCDTEMEDDLFDERHIRTQGGVPSPIIQEQSRKATKQFEDFKTKYDTTKSRRRKDFIDQDLLEPYIYGTVPPDKKGLLDESIENSDKLVPPLLKKISVCAKDPFESFEKQLDQSLKFFKEDSKQFADTSQGQRVFLDSDFLNKRIEGENIPADNSIIGDDEMNVEDFSGIDEYMPVQDTPKQYNNDPNITTGMEKMLENLSSQSSEVINQSLSPGQRLRQTLNIVNKYRKKRCPKLPPTYEIPYTQLENESFPFSTDSESLLDITPKSDIDIWDSRKMDEMEKRLGTLRQEATAHHQRGRQPLVEDDVPTRNNIQKSTQSSADVKRLRNRYKILQEQQLNKQKQSKYSGTFQRPLPVLDPVPHSEVEDIDDLFDISERAESSDICDASQRYDPILKQYITTQNLADVSMPEADFVGDEILKPNLVSSIYHSTNFPKRGESDSASDIQRPQLGIESDRRMPFQPESTQRPNQETPHNIPGYGARRKLLYEMTSQQAECSQLPLNVSPRERIKLLIEQQPNVEVSSKPRTNEYSPLKFVTKQIPKKPYQLEDETFPKECPPEDMYDNLGELAHALYIPTEAEEREIVDFNRNRRIGPTPPGAQRSPPRNKENIQDASPIGRTNVLPGEEGFKWLPNYMPFEQQVGEDRLMSTQQNQFIAQSRLQQQPQRNDQRLRPSLQSERQASLNQRQGQGPQRVKKQLPNKLASNISLNKPQGGPQQVRQASQRIQKEFRKKNPSSSSLNQKQIPPIVSAPRQQQTQRQDVGKRSTHVTKNSNVPIPTTAKLEIVSERQKGKEIIMRKSETVTRKKEPKPQKNCNTFEPKRKEKLEYSRSGNIIEKIGQPQTSIQIRKLTSGAVGQCGRSLVEKSSMTVKKDYGKKCQKIVKASEVKYSNAKEQRVKEYTFATKK